MKSRLTPFLIASVFILFQSCGDGTTATSIEMTRTVNLAEHMGTATEEFDLTGFRIGLAADAPTVTSVTWTATSIEMGAAGSETPPCNDGDKYALSNVAGTDLINDLVIEALVIGDTGEDDISTDRDCGCDTHVSKLRLNNIRFEGESEFGGFGGTTLGKAELCPNRIDDLIIGGGNDFNGAVWVDLTCTLRIQNGLPVLDVTYFVQKSV